TQRRALAERADAIYGRYAGQGGNEIPSALSLPLLLVEGQWETAWAIAESALPAVQPPHPNMLARVSWEQLAGGRGETAVAWEQIGVMLPDGMATEPGSVSYRPAVAMILLAATLSLDAGDLRSAASWLRLHGDFLAHSGAVLGRSEAEAL